MAEKLSEQFAQMNILDFKDKVIGRNLTAEAAFCNKVGDIFEETYFNQKILFRSSYSRLLMSFFFSFLKKDSMKILIKNLPGVLKKHIF